MKSVFLSYSSSDRKAAQSIGKRLEAYYDVFLDFSGIPGGTEWEREIESAIRKSDVFLLIVTPHSTKSEWVTRETLFAEHLKKPRVPALLKGDMPFRIIHLQYVDFRGDFESGFVDLLEALQAHAPPRPRNEHQADQLLGASVRARINGEVELSDRLLRQALSLDNNIKEFQSDFWQQLMGAVDKTSLNKLTVLNIVEEATERGESIYDDRSTYDWSLHLEGDDEVLNSIDHVAYRLHPTFKPQNQIVRSRKNGFRLSQVGWGIFEVGLTIQLKDGQSVNLSYDLTFEESNRVQIEVPKE